MILIWVIKISFSQSSKFNWTQGHQHFFAVLCWILCYSVFDKCFRTCIHWEKQKATIYSGCVVLFKGVWANDLQSFMGVSGIKMECNQNVRTTTL
jgi:hypothetical protein